MPKRLLYLTGFGNRFLRDRRAWPHRKIHEIPVWERELAFSIGGFWGGGNDGWGISETHEGIELKGFKIVDTSIHTIHAFQNSRDVSLVWSRRGTIKDLILDNR
jgi:hypothetical protein